MTSNLEPQSTTHVDERVEPDDSPAPSQALDRPPPAPRPPVDPIARPDPISGLDSDPHDERPSPTAGPLVAVCALCGGAGASTVAYLTARSMARAADEPVLLCDTGGPSGGLATYAGTESPRSLPRLANAVAAHEPLAGGLFADGGEGLRILASRPHLDAEADERGLARVLRDAREAHGLTVVDCGTLRGEADRHVLETATHVVWVLPATVSGVRRGWRVLELFGVDQPRREVVVARHDAAGRKPPTEHLGALAAARNAPLVLMPHLPDLGDGPSDAALELAGASLDAVRIAIRR